MNFKTFYKEFLQGYSPIRITSDFGWRTLRGQRKFHAGIDIGTPVGTVLLAPLDGKIIKKAVQRNGAGLYVTLQHEAAPGVYVYVLMMHLHTVDPHIHVGYEIAAGERIGTTGGAVGDQPNAGSSTGPHLHLEIRKGGYNRANAVDPKNGFLARETLILQKNQRIVHVGKDIEFFSDEEISTQATESKTVDATTVEQATEAPAEKQEKKNVEKERLALGIWQIVKILIDDSVADKQVLDSGISTQMGPLINYFRKICQEPLVEFMGDTYGNQYYWIVRKPPFDKEGLLKMMELALIPLDSSKILSTNLSWNTQGIYSWYQYTPYANLLGIREASQITPAVFFPEYASIWGSKPLCVESNYFTFVFSGNHDQDISENSENNDRILKNAIKDLKYLIESNAYNPFTRRGTITIVGDRRIKRGTLISLPDTGEIFHVDAVNNSYSVSTNSVNRTTTLQVSRGMYPEYIQGVKLTDETAIGYINREISYFNLINFGEDFDIEKIDSSNWRDYLSKWHVNLDSLGFFLSKQQIASNVYRKHQDHLPLKVRHNG